LRFAALSIGAPCLYIMIPCFWSLPSRLLVGAQAAAGVAAINSLGNLGGFFGQNIMPWVQRATGSVSAPMIVPACCLLVLAIGAVIAWRVYGTERPLPHPGAAHAKG
jgi:nitrate/nitrite transporter NarK